MSKLVSSIVGRVREIVGNRRHVSRRTARVSARLPFTIGLLEPGTVTRQPLSGKRSLTGHTSDLSETGMTLVLPSVRIGNSYLTEETHYLLIELETPSGLVTMLGSPARFAYTEDAGYLLGVKIIKMQDEDHATYLSYLRTLAPRERRVRKQSEDTIKSQTIPDNRGLQQLNTWASITPRNVNDAFERFLRER